MALYETPAEVYSPAIPKAMLLDKVGDGDPFWGSAERDSALAESLSVWQAITDQWLTSFQLALEAGADQYVDVPKQVAIPRRVLWNGVPLTEISQWELDYGFPGWYTTSGTPSMWAPIGINLIALDRTPATAGVLSIEGYREAGDANSPLVADLGTDRLARLIGYARHVLSFKEGPTESESSIPDMQAFLEEAAKANAEIRATEMYRRWMGEDRQQIERSVTVGPATPGARN